MFGVSAAASGGSLVRELPSKEAIRSYRSEDSELGSSYSDNQSPGLVDHVRPERPKFALRTKLSRIDCVSKA